MLPVPTIAELAAFTGRGPDAYTGFASTALAQATLLFTLRSQFSVLPTDADQALLVKYAILQMADHIFLEQPNAVVRSSPFQSETIGSYTYSKGSAVTRAQDGESTGLYWWDLALDQLGRSDTDVDYGSVQTGIVDIAVLDASTAYLITPADIDDSDAAATVL